MIETVKMVKSHLILVLILSLAVLLRFIGTNPSFDKFHSDEGISYSAATDMVVYGNFDPKRYDYPAFVPDINYLFFKVFFVPGAWTFYYLSHLPSFLNGNIHLPLNDVEYKKILINEIVGVRYTNSLFWSRYITALVSVANVWLIYLLAKKMFNKPVGLIAAFLLTFNFKHVQNAHIGLPDIYNSFTLLVFLLALLHLLVKKTNMSYLITGVAIGLSFSTKYQVFTIPPFVLGHIYNSWINGKLDWKKLIRPAFFGGLLVAAIVFVVLNPYFFVHLDKAVKQMTDTANKYALGKNSLNLYPLWYFYYIDYGPTELLFVGVGMVIALKKYLKKTIILLSVLMPFFYMFLYYSNGGFYVRNFITVAPLILIFAAIGCYSLFHLIKRINYNFAVVVLMTTLAMMVYIPGKNAIINSYYYTKPWNYDVLREWEEQNLSGKLVIASHPFDPVIERKGISRTEFELSGAYSFAEHRENGANMALMSLDWAGNPFYFWMNFGFDKFQDYWNKPYDLMRNSYWGIAAEELFRYQIFSITKPWQAPDANLILARIPVWPEAEMSKIREFAFNTGMEDWTADKSAVRSFEFDPDIGNNLSGSLAYISGKSSSGIIKISSLPINIKPGHLYRITGFLKTNQKLLTRQREGFLRIDFYRDNDDTSKIGLNTSVSARVFNNDDWVKKQVIERAPDDTTKLVVSWQLSTPFPDKFWMDDLIIEESVTQIKSPTSEPPYNYKEIDRDLLYPNSHGNL